MVESTEKQSVQDYNSTYYEDNKERLAADKKKKYEDDPEYRARVKKSRQAWYERKQKAKGDYVFRTVNGKTHKVLKIGIVVAKLGITTTILHNWVARGVVPKADKRFGRSSCYTDAQFKVLAHVAKARKSVQSIAELKVKVNSYVKTNWFK